MSSSYGKKVISGLFALEAGEETSIDLVYDLPPSMVQHDSDSIKYEILVQKQPGVQHRSTTVELIPPPGYRLRSSSVNPAINGDSSVAFLLPGNLDSTLSVEFVEGGDDLD